MQLYLYIVPIHISLSSFLPRLTLCPLCVLLGYAAKLLHVYSQYDNKNVDVCMEVVKDEDAAGEKMLLRSCSSYAHFLKVPVGLSIID